MPERVVCFITGSRAEYGLLAPVMEAVQGKPSLRLRIIATGMHLSNRFGLTIKDIEKDGFSIDAKVDMQLTDDKPTSVTKSMGIGVIGFADAFEQIKPDIIVLLGDRFEILAAAEAALIARIPVAHIAGGDITEGAFDDAIRHSITKMSHLHFVTNHESGRRVRQLGENPEHIFVVGSPGIDALHKTKLLTREELEQNLNFNFQEKNILVTFHPATLEDKPAGAQFRELLAAIDRLGQNVGVIFTLPNADPDSSTIVEHINAYTKSRTNAKAYASLGTVRYLSCIAQVDAVVGNSSSGLYEVPSFKRPTVNIGDRQKGRLTASSVISCRCEAADIERAIREAFEKDCSDAVNPYGDGKSAERIATILASIPDYRVLLKKKFFDLTQ